MNRGEMLAEVRRRLAAVAGDKSSDESDLQPLREELRALESELQQRRLPADAWEDHELNWAAHTARLRADVVRRSAHIMLAFEDLRRKNPLYGVGDPELEKLFEWWLDEGGRESWLASLPLEERRALEKQAADWAERDDLSEG